MCQSGIKCHCKQSSGSDVHAHCSQQKWCKEREGYISGGKNTQEQGQLSPTVLDVVAAVIYVARIFSYGCIMDTAARTEVGHHKSKMFENTWSKYQNMLSAAMHIFTYSISIRKITFLQDQTGDCQAWFLGQIVNCSDETFPICEKEWTQ